MSIPTTPDADIPRLVVESTLEEIILAFKDINGNPIDITGATEIKLQGESADIVTTIDTAATIYDAGQGLAKVASAGNLITAAQLGSLHEAKFLLRGRLKDAAAKIGYGDEFFVYWHEKPVS